MLAGQIVAPGEIKLIEIPEPEFTSSTGEIIFNRNRRVCADRTFRISTMLSTAIPRRIPDRSGTRCTKWWGR